MKQIVNAIAKDWISEKIATPPPQANDSRDCGKNETRWPYFSKWMYEQAKINIWVSARFLVVEVLLEMSGRRWVLVAIRE